METQDTATQEPQQQESYAVRPERHHKRLSYSDPDNMLRVRNILNIAFMVLAIVGVILWYNMSSRTVPSVILIVAVALKIVEVCIRMFRK